MVVHWQRWIDCGGGHGRPCLLCLLLPMCHHTPSLCACRRHDHRLCALLIMGFATSLEGWKPQLADMLEPRVRSESMWCIESVRGVRCRAGWVPQLAALLKCWESGP